MVKKSTSTKVSVQITIWENQPNNHTESNLSVAYTSGSQAIRINEGRRIPIIDALIEDLKYERWDEGETLCFQETIQIFDNVKNFTLWATWIWDSMQLPVGTLYGSRYQLSNFDQCMKTHGFDRPLRIQYCLADVQLTEKTPKAGGAIDAFHSAESFIMTTSIYGRHLNKFTWGACMPASCAPNSVAKLLRHLLQHTHLPILSDASITVNPLDCQVSGTAHRYSTGFYLFLYLLAFLFIITISSTYFIAKETDSMVTKITKSFCAKRNWTLFIKAHKEDIRSINGIRCINAGSAVCMHYIYFLNVFAVSNALNLDEEIYSTLGSMMAHFDIKIDTFLVISGLLFIRGLMMNKSMKRNYLKILLKRYIRLIAHISLMVFYMTAVSGHVGSGPVWPRLSRVQQEACSKNWWLNLLMIQNHVNTSEICYPITWYISCDYQLMILGGILYILCQRSRHTAIVSITVAFILTLLIPALLTYWNDLPIIILYNYEDGSDLNQNIYFLTSYMKSYNRAVPYLFGMAMGYVMSIYKPNDYRKVIPKFWSAALTIVALTLLYGVLYIGGVLFQRQEYSTLEASAYASLDKTFWAIGICCLIGVCEYGTVPFINDILSSYMFVLLSRLSYGLYLTHMAIIYRNLYSTRAPFTHDVLHLTINGLGVIPFSYMISLILWFILEAPVINISSLIFDDKKKRELLNKRTDKQNDAAQSGVINKKIL